MAKRIDYASIVGNKYGNYKVISYDGRDFKTKKHLYTVEFKCGDTVRTYPAQHYHKVISGKCVDPEQKKLDSQTKKAENIKKRFKCSKKSVEHYERIPDLANKTVMAIDGSTNSTGFCISRNHKIIKSGEIKPKQQLETRLRMGYMRIELQKLIQQYGVDVVFYEDVIFKNINVMKILGRLQGHIESVVPLDCKFILINPSSWKNWHKFTGKRAEQKKAAIEYASKLLKRACGEDEADAVCMMIYCVKNLGIKEST